MERLRLPRLPRLLAAAVIVECCARLCPGLSSGTSSTLGTAIPCDRLGTTMGERCRTGLEQGAGTGQTLTPEAVGQLQTEAALLPFPGTPARTAEPLGPRRSPGGPQAGRGGTGPVVRGGTATERPGALLSAGTAAQAAAGSTLLSPAPASVGPDTAPATRTPPGTESVGNVIAEAATTPQGTPSHSPSSVVVPSSARGQWGSPSTLPEQTPMGTGVVQRQGDSRGPSSPGLWAGDTPSATVLLGDNSPGTHPSTDSPALGTIGTSPFGGGLQRLLSSVGTWQGTRQGLLGPAEWGSDSHPWHGTDVTWQGPGQAPRPSPPSVGPSGRGDPLASTAQPAPGMGPTLLPAAGKGSGVPVPTTTASTAVVTSPGLGGTLNPTLGVSGPPDTEGPHEHSHVPLDQTLTSASLSSTSVAQSGVSHASPGSPHVPLATQPALTSSAAVPTSSTLLNSLKTSQGVPEHGPTVSTTPAGLSPRHQLPHAGLGEDTADIPQNLGVSDAEAWMATAPLSWQPGSLPPTSASGPSWQPSLPQPASSLGLTTAIHVTTAAVTATITTATASPALLEDVRTATPESSAAVSQGDVTGLTWGPPTHLSTMVPGSPQQPTNPLGTLGHHGGHGSPPAAMDTGLVQPSSPGGQLEANTSLTTPAAAGRAPRVFIVEDQPPLLRASLLRIPCELVLDMGFVPTLQDPESHERRGLLHSFNQTVSPLFMSVPGFLRLEVTGIRIREGSVVLEYDALFAAERVQAPGLGALLDAMVGSGSTRGLMVGTAPVLRNVALEWPLDPCSVLFTCRAGFTCVARADGNATCTSLCHRDYCKNHGICTHPRDRGPLCQCPVGSDFWFMGLRCDYRVTQQSLLGMAAGVLLSIILLVVVVAAVAIRRFKSLLLEARADQTRSSYRRFCRLDDVSAQYWSRSWLPSASSLDNPAFSNSEELLHLQILDNGCCSCREDSGIADSSKQHPAPPARPDYRPSFHYEWDTSSSSMNDPMVDSGKASDISVSSWPMEPIQWTPFPLLHQLSRQRPHKARRPHSYCEGMELVNLERSWTA